ncbi:hypothetical protein LCGC14_2342610 [marine sediment metagenome]|uniref:Uncharacterized protein n=1 Tax=marine sediment metagenome TaxID=412755 RepID=A0A0F9EP86_9ZZZZ
MSTAIEMAGCERALMEDAGNKAITDFAKVNKAIMERWSHSALLYIKNKAWAVVDGREHNDMPEVRA